MGQALSCSDPETRVDRAISESLRKEYKSLANSALRLVLLGPGSSGKSTIYKQAKIVYKGGFTEEERSLYKQVIHANCIDAVLLMIEFLRKNKEDLMTEDLRELSKPVLLADRASELTRELGERMAGIWKHPSIQYAYEERARFQLSDNAGYFLTHVTRVTAKMYIPTEEDVIRSRFRTSGIVETQVMIEGVRFDLIDVGGQRGERRKWIHLFQTVQAVLYVAAISEYDQVCAEDNTQNRLTEALVVFQDVCKRMPQTPIVLFLNKQDLLYEKMKEKKSPLSALFPEYTGGFEVKAAIRFIEGKFLERAGQRDIYVHLTSAVDTAVMRKVFHSVRDYIIRKSLTISSLV
eukprot:c1863_g1_i1.p1 GENE.c1863_g1_i1~~c1863_g1_i1.p1  ORF type:complete len:349 (+),score=47.97 c1863_g1_i1:45-1091(+)